jgi:hypothetical protein
LFSGTCGSDSTALVGSRYGTRGISSRPAPSLPRAARLVPCREREVRPPVPEVPPLLLAVGWDPEEVDAAGAGTAPATGTATAGAGAIPQVLQ